MLTQQALHVDLADGRHDVVELESPHFVGPLAYGWDIRGQDDPTVLGAGPLLPRGVPGAGALLMAGRSPLWDGFLSSVMEGAGPSLQALGFPLLALRGRAARTSLLLLRRRGAGLEVSLRACDPEPLWQEGGLPLLAERVAGRWVEETPHLRVLAVGPAAARTRCGVVGSLLFQNGRLDPVRGWFGRSGFGSRLLQLHGLCAIVLGGDEVPSPETLPGERLRPGMSQAELEAAVRFQFSPRLRAGGTLAQGFRLLRQRTLWFNSSSVQLSDEEREELFTSALLPHLLLPALRELQDTREERTCGEPCPLRCRLLAGNGRRRELEPYSALGPQLGVAELSAVDRLVERCELLGLDPVAAGGTLGWLMERLHRGLVEPGDLWVSDRPRWSVSEFQAEADSAHNARLAEKLLDGWLAAPWGEPLRDGLRAGARAAGGPSAALAVYNANGETGEMVPLPFWAPGIYTPLPLAGDWHAYYGLEFVPPRILGRKSAQRLIAELGLQNLGICRLHRGWAEELVPDLVNQVHQTGCDWPAIHRQLAHRLFRRRKARFWETERMIDVIGCFLQSYQHDNAPDAELDRWVRRFREDRAGAARAFWSEVNAGLEEILGA